MLNNLYQKNLTSDPFEGVVTQKYDAKPLNILQKKKKKDLPFSVVTSCKHGKESSITYVCKMLRKTNISTPLIRTRACAYRGLRNVNFSENFAYVLKTKHWFHTCSWL